jgi:ADP-ribose pyrophosphatase YjhB (NUDIX family)
MGIPDTKITACSCLIVSKDKKILAFCRNNDTINLEVPFGKRSFEESLIAAASRELFSKIGTKIDISVVDKVFIHPKDEQNGKDEEYCATFIVFMPQASHEVNLNTEDSIETLISDSYPLWIAPQDFLDKAVTTNIRYNKALLKFAELIQT